jgi:hypothetical protein
MAHQTTVLPGVIMRAAGARRLHVDDPNRNVPYLTDKTNLDL